MRSRVVACAAVVISLAAMAPAAAGEQWSAPVDGCQIALPFGAQYAGKTHRGLDLTADAGTDVRAPASGTVTFAGTVPADGGGTCGAVTVEFADGLKVSLLPLAEVFVSAGDPVSAADVVGALAAAGDDSSPASHLHLGARRGSAYVDPAGFLPLAGAETSEPTLGAVTELPEPAQAPAVPPSPVGVPSGSASALGTSSTIGEATTGASAVVRSSVSAAPAVASGSPAPRVGLTRTRDTHAIPEDAGVPAPSALAHPAAANAGWAVSIPTVAAAGATLPAAAAAASALLAVAGPKLRAARVKAS